MIQSLFSPSPAALLPGRSHQLLLYPPLSCHVNARLQLDGFIMNWQNQRLIAYRQGMKTREGYGSCKSQKKLVAKISPLTSSFLGYHLPQDFCESFIFNFCEEGGRKSLLQCHCFPFLSSHAHQQARPIPVFSTRASKMSQIIWTLAKFYATKQNIGTSTF